MTYATPVRDYHFALNHMAGFQELVTSGSYDDLSDDLMSAILDEIAKFCNQELVPLNEISDRNGAILENGAVRTSPGFKEAYRLCAEGGWLSIAHPEEIGGQGLPTSLNAVFTEAISGGCMSFSFCPMINFGAVRAINAVASEAQRRLVLPKLVSGEWMATMNLTEPQAGSDLSGIKTKAEPVDDGRYKITGQKIFITYGDHDLTENIVHLVLARTPGAPEGTRGISMFLVPKVNINDDGTLGDPNDVRCVSLEEKMGIHGSPTCVMSYGEQGNCYATLLGKENYGLHNMFVMMNAARVDVGLQGVGVAERSFQKALAYAQERQQGYLPGKKSGLPVPIFEHLDVRRMLYTMKALVEASRAICLACSVAGDLAESASDEARRKKFLSLEGLLVPLAKAWSSDRANEVTSLGVQVHGGMGYIEETGAAQLMRDARIVAIYEGTNGIQAIDLVTRKVLGDRGTAVTDFLASVREVTLAAINSENTMLRQIGNRLMSSSVHLESSTEWLLKTGQESSGDVLAGAAAYLKLFGNVAGGFFLTKGALAATSFSDYQQSGQSYYKSKVAIADFYAETFLTETEYLTTCVSLGADRLMRLDPETLT